MSETGGPGPERVERMVEVLLVTILALATLTAAWSSYQAARWSGVQSTSFSLASARRVDATRAATSAGQLGLYDASVFTSWLTARSSGNAALEAFEAARFRAEFRQVFDAWLATRPFDDPTAPSSPFVMPAYQAGLESQTSALESQASALFEAGVAANQQADDYVLDTVFLAISLFFAGIASRFAWRRARFAVVTMAVIAFGYGLFSVLGSPIH